MYTFYGVTPYIHILRRQAKNVEIVHKNVFRPCRRDILSFNELKSIKVWKQKDELFYYIAIEYLYYKINGIHDVQGLGGITLWGVIDQDLRIMELALETLHLLLLYINEIMEHIKKTNMLLPSLR